MRRRSGDAIVTNVRLVLWVLIAVFGFVGFVQLSGRSAHPSDLALATSINNLRTVVSVSAQQDDTQDPASTPSGSSDVEAEDDDDNNDKDDLDDDVSESALGNAHVDVIASVQRALNANPCRELHLATTLEPALRPPRG